MAKKSPKDTPDAVKLFFVASLWFATLAGFVQVITLMIQQYPSNPNMSGFVSWIIRLFVPVVMGLILYLCRRSKDLSLNTIYEVTLLSLVGYMFYIMTIAVLPEITGFFPITYGFAMFILYYSLVPSVLALGLVLFIALVLRHKKQW